MLLLILILIVVGVLWRFIGLYIRVDQRRVGLLELVGMSLRKVSLLRS